jgi:NitT/TauT family transport system ATP-binding protein
MNTVVHAGFGVAGLQPPGIDAAASRHPVDGSPVLALRDITHRFGPETVLEKVDLSLARGEVLALLGRSGCGKTTLLRIAAGLLAPSEGQVEAGFRDAAVVFQQPDLLPWKRVLDNIAFGLKARGMPRVERRERARALARQVGLRTEDLDKYPAELSGGMQSRVAFARALAIEPDILLMDEPFSALDLGLRSQMHALLAARISTVHSAGLLVTHDLMDALRIAHEVVLMEPCPGRVLVRFRIERPLAERDDAWVYCHTGLLLDHPTVRSAFELPLRTHGVRECEARLGENSIHVLPEPPVAALAARRA